MSMRVYISADYDRSMGDQNVVNELIKWGTDKYHRVDFIDMAKPSSGSVTENEDCRSCDLKGEFNRQINASSAVIFIVGDKTASRMAGSGCERLYKEQRECFCTPYKKNVFGSKQCKIIFTSTPGEYDDFGNVNCCSYLQHEFEQAKKKQKKIIIIYNSTRRENSWLPSYMNGYKIIARPFWIYNKYGERVGDYSYIKEVLGF